MIHIHFHENVGIRYIRISKVSLQVTLYTHGDTCYLRKYFLLLFLSTVNLKMLDTVNLTFHF